MPKRFQGLYLIAVILKIVGAVSLLIAFVSLIMLPLIFAENDGIFSSLGLYDAAPGTGLVGGIVAGILIFIFEGVLGTIVLAIGGMADVLVAIEENTRASIFLQQGANRE